MSRTHGIAPRSPAAAEAIDWFGKDLERGDGVRVAFCRRERRRRGVVAYYRPEGAAGGGRACMTRSGVSSTAAPELSAGSAFLERVVRPGPVRAGEVCEAAEAERLSAKTLRRAKAHAGIEALAVDGAWRWRFPPTVAAHSDEPAPAVLAAPP